MGDIFLMLLIIVGLAIALYLYNKKIMKKAAAEKERQAALVRAEQERQEAFNNWKEALNKQYSEIQQMSLRTPLAKDVYSKIWNMYTPEYETYFNSALNSHQRSLTTNILNGVIGDKKSMLLALNKICFLKASYKDDTKFDVAIKKIDDFCTQISKPEPQYLLINGYGDFNLPLDDVAEMTNINENALQILNELNLDVHRFSNNTTGLFEGITKYLDKTFLYDAAKVMWYYAKKKPFNVMKFEESRTLYNKYTSVTFVPERYAKNHPEEHTFRIGKVEEILAVLYSKNQIGGKGTVQQEKEYIDAWLENKISNKNVKECSLFVSGMAWLELYELELEALHKMVQENMQLSAELQERLSFLESGGASSNVKVYEIKPENNFAYDSSSENWNTNEFNMFFRKVGMKKMNINYSLAISSWKKTLPLTSGQNVSMDDIYFEFQKMIKDFDGEVTCKRTTAQAIDLENVIYKDVVLFSFSSERNKCLSMLFICEKFGKNLNITIITLFTPENGIDTETLQKYAVAIKSNIYIDSFRETILQSVDEVIKEEKNIYDDDVPSSSKKFVE